MDSCGDGGMMSDYSKGFLAMITACCIWGLSGLYYKALAVVPAIEVLAHRTIWSSVFFIVILALQGRVHLLRDILRSKSSALQIVLAAIAIAINWFVFIWAIHSGHATEASFGYFVYPLMVVALGVVVFKEKLSPLRWVAIASACVAVLVLGVGQGVVPVVPVVIALSFASYSVIKKLISVGPVVSVTAEVTSLVPVALLVLWWLSQTSGLGHSAMTYALLIGSGMLTAAPLILFSYATKRVDFSTIGILQYLNPSIQFIVAYAIFAEPLGYWYKVAFPIIWGALVIYSFGTLRARR